MVESTQQDPYLQQLEEVTGETLTAGLKSLYDSGYVDFEENKIMIESNPGMSLEDIMICIDESKKDGEGTNLEDLDADQSSDVGAGEMDEKDIEEMNALVGHVVDSNTETDPENEDAEDDKA